MSDYASEGGHWYKPCGATAYTYTDKDGVTQDTTLRQARKYGWFPSVSGVMGVAAKPALENWKMNELAKVCGQNPRNVDESLDNYVLRVRRIDREQKDIAPDLGSAIHACIEKHLRGEAYEQEHRDNTVAAVAAFDNWCGLADIRSEKSFAHPLGFGGKCDLHKPGYLVDFKTAKFTEANLPKAWDNHFMQLAAYREGLCMGPIFDDEGEICVPGAECSIIFISTTQPGLAHLVRVMEDDLKHGWELFCAYLTAWKIQKKYDPTKGNGK